MQSNKQDPSLLLGQTPSQTVGPYFAYGLTPEQYGYNFKSIASSTLADETTPGARIRIEGKVFDGAGLAVTDAMIEIWQADHAGNYASKPGTNAKFSGFGRCGTGTAEGGLFWFDTVKPGVATAGDAPHVNMIVKMRGLLLHLFTRVYFEDELAANTADPVLMVVPVERQKTLLARLVSPGVYRFDIHMQGADETVFFDL